jgi:hypothetical protein
MHSVAGEGMAAVSAAMPATSTYQPEENMLPKMITMATVTVMILLAATMYAYAGDLDDEIKIDDKIVKYDALERPGTNIQYIKRRAKASASSSAITSSGSGDLAIGGFINKPGAEVGDVTIIFNGEDITAISE